GSEIGTAPGVACRGGAGLAYLALDPPPERRPMSLTTSTKKTGTVWDTIKTVLYAIAIALLIRTAAVEPFNIPSGSMIPTLLVGDYLFVSKFSYGYSRYSLPFGLPLIPGRVLFREPERGDVAVF